ncbi:MAG: hypothetical protein ACLPVF_02490 [Acidimicrobiales bacterium]
MASPAVARWYLRHVIDDTSASMVSYRSDRFPDGYVADAAEVAGTDLSGDDRRWQARYDPGTGRLLSVLPNSGPGLWFVEDQEPGAEPPAACLIGFTTPHYPPGTVVSNDEFQGMPVDSTAQVGAIRLWVGTGQIHEIYVQPELRRDGVGGALVQAAGAYQITGGRPPIWASGDRTDLGEAFARARAVQRIQPRRSTVAPMTPEHRRRGVPDRNLYPDP